MNGLAMGIISTEEIEQRKMQMAMALAPAWPVVDVQDFTWTHGLRELIAERKRVCEIMALRAQVEKPKDHNNSVLFEFSMSFQEAFVENDGARVALMQRINSFRDWKSYIVEKLLYSFPVGPNGTAERKANRESEWCAGVNLYYKLTQAVLHNMMNNVLLMQALCAELKPETLALARRCRSHEELDHSMLCMLQTPKFEGFPFEEPRDLCTRLRNTMHVSGI